MAKKETWSKLKITVLKTLDWGTLYLILPGHPIPSRRSGHGVDMTILIPPTFSNIITVFTGFSGLADLSRGLWTPRFQDLLLVQRELWVQGPWAISGHLESPITIPYSGETQPNTGCKVLQAQSNMQILTTDSDCHICL